MHLYFRIEDEARQEVISSARKFPSCSQHGIEMLYSMNRNGFGQELEIEQ